MFAFSLASSSFMYAANYPLIFLLSLYLQYVRGLTPLESGQLMLLQALAMALLAPFAGRFSDKWQPRLISTAGCVIIALGFAILSQLDYHTPTNHIGGALLLIGIGFGFFSAPNNNAIMSSVHQDEVGVAAASTSLARVCGNLVGISLINLLVQVMMGNNQITEALYPQLLTTIRYALGLALFFVLLAVLCSSLRGKTGTHPGASTK